MWDYVLRERMRLREIYDRSKPGHRADGKVQIRIKLKVPAKKRA